MEVLYGWLIGLMIGMRHALEPDHLAAVSTIVTENKGRRASLLLGAAWGAGHTLTLVLAGGVLVLLRKQMPPNLEAAAELAVAFMLVGLGARALWQAWKEGRGGPRHRHLHAHGAHEHTGAHDHVHVRSWTMARRPLLVGIVHGLAGSGALTAAVLASMPSVRSGLIYLVLFGAGSAVGMALLTGITGEAIAGLAKRRYTTAVLLGASGALSLVMGLFWGLQHAMALLA